MALLSVGAAGRALRSRPRLVASALLGLAVGLGSDWGLARLPGVGGVPPALLGWNVFTLAYLVLAWHMAHGSNQADLRARAHDQHEGRFVVLGLGLAAVAWSMLAIASQLGDLRSLHGADRSLRLGLVALTVVTSWLFTQVLFALHYAHGFCVARLRHGADPMQFPGTSEPDYGDFLYAACIIGTSGQTADVSFTSSRMRRVATVHCVMAFVFNTTTLALGVNIAASLF